MAPQVRYERDADGVGTVTLDRPGARNAFDDGMAAEMVDRFREAVSDAECRALVVTGAGDSFCAGGDLYYMESAVRDGRVDDAMKLVLRGTEVVRLVHRAPMPVLAAVNGPAVGGGASLALACDLRFLRDDARLHLSYATLGLIPAWGGSYFLPRLVGRTKALELLLLPEPIDAPGAVALGIANDAFPAPGFLETVRSRARAIASLPRPAIRSIKSIVHASPERPFEHALAVEEREQRAMFESPEARERLSQVARPRREEKDGAPS